MNTKSIYTVGKCLLLLLLEGVSKLTFACYLFLFRHGLHGKHRFSLFFFP